MSIDMYNFIIDNIDRLKYDLEKGIVISPKGTNGTVCTSTGYLRVRVLNKVLQVHQIMSVMYFGEECIDKQINHIDGNKLNNKRDNLEAITQKENIQHGWETGLFENSKKNGKQGESHGGSKLKEEQVVHIRNSNKTSNELSEIFNVGVRTINSIKSGETWKHLL